MVLSDKDMLDVVHTIPMPTPWDREAFVQGIADMRGRPITLIAAETVFLADRLCGMWLEREDDDVLLYERGASLFRIDKVICHQIGHIVLGHHSGARSKSCDVLADSVWLRALPDVAPQLVNTVLDSTDYGDEQEHEADLFALLMLNSAEGEEYSMSRKTPPGRSTASMSQQRAPAPTADADQALVRGYARELKIACDDLRDEPFSPEARANLIRLILQDSKNADAANKRLQLAMRSAR